MKKMRSTFFTPIAGSRERPIRNWILLLGGVFTWSIAGVVLTALVYVAWPEPREVWQEYVANFAAFVPLFVLMLVTPKILGRRPLSAVTASTNMRWNLVWFGFWSWGLLLVLESLFKLIQNPGDFAFTFPGIPYLWPLLVSVVLLPIQTSSEELLFRGALPQTLATVIRSPKVVLVVSGVLFGAAHLSNPEAQHDPIVSLIGYSVAGIGWGWVTYKSAGIELAIGAHTVNNFYGLLVVGYSNSAITGSAIWTTPNVDMRQSTVSNLLMMAVWIFALRRTFLESNERTSFTVDNN